MLEYQQRVIEEAEELHERLCKLESFMITQVCFGLPVDEQERLSIQRTAMRAYHAALRNRISHF